jgi:SAM-dependent methyltransferase
MLPALRGHFGRIELVEPSQSMMDLLRLTVGSSDSAVHIHVAHVEDIPLQSNSVDVALAKSSLHHFADRDRAIREMARISANAIAVLEVVSPDPSCLEFARELVLQKEPGRDPSTIYSEQDLVSVMQPYCTDCSVLHFDQYIDVNVWLECSDLHQSQVQALLALVKSQRGSVRQKMQIQYRSGHLIQLRRLALVIGSTPDSPDRE